MSSPFHGLLLVDKDSGGTSHDVVAQVRRILGTRSVGHSGTLDPLASGLMVLLVGEGTKLSHYILEGDKSYRVKLRLGLVTDTLDITGAVLEERPVQASIEQIEAAARELVGEFQWEVPLYSAVKVQGQRLHEYARRGEDVQVPTKTMSFWDLKTLKIDPPFAEFEMTCSKGSYIRTWVSQLGAKLGCGATMEALERTGSEPYELDRASKLSLIQEQWKQGSLSDCFVPMIEALPRVKRVKVKGPDQTLLMNGQISHDLRSMLISQFRPGQDELVQVHSVSNQLLALVGLEKGKGFTIRRVFRYTENAQ